MARPALPEELRRSAAHVFVDDLEAPALGEDDAHHLLRVMRLRDGEPVTASDGRGSWRSCRLVTGPGRSPLLEPVGDRRAEPALQPEITLAVALPKGDRGDWAVQKMTECGADRIIPLTAERSVVRWAGERADRALERLRRISRQAAMQSRRVRLVELSAPQTVADVVTAAGGRAVVAEPGGGWPDLAHPTVLVGPEGGWAPGELPEDVALVGLGPGILRTETACVLAVGVLSLLRSR